MTADYRRTPTMLLQLALLGAACVAGIVLSERVDHGEGFGWDGIVYGRVAQDPVQRLLVDPVGPYQLQRVLPSVVVGSFLRVAGASPTAANVVLGFLLYNALLMVGMCVLWNRIARRLELSSGAHWLGFIALFVNVAMLRNAAYYPVLTDVSAAALGLLFLELHLSGRRVALALASILGAFAWPLATYYGATLLLLPTSAPPLDRTRPTRLGVWLGGALGVLAAAGCLFMYHERGYRSPGMGPITVVVEEVVYVGIVLSSVYLALVVGSYARGVSTRTVRTAAARLRKIDVALALAVLLVPRVVIAAIAVGPSFMSLKDFLYFAMYGSVTRPALPLVAHAVYLGPVVLMIAPLWSEVRDAAAGLGAGVLCVAAISLLLLISPESRQGLLGWPMLVALIAVAADRCVHLTRGVVATVGLLAVISVKPWMSFVTPPGGAPEAAWMSLSPDLREQAVRYRRYFMHHGPWMPNREYVVQGLVVLLAAVLIAVLLWAHRRNRCGT